MMRTFFKGQYLDFTLTLQIQSLSTLFLRIVDRKCEDYVYELIIDDRFLQQQNQKWFNLFDSPSDLYEFLSANFDSIIIDNQGEIHSAFKVPGLSSQKTVTIRTQKINVDRLWKLQRELQNIRKLFQSGGFTEQEILKKLNGKLQQSAVKIQENISKKMEYLQKENIEIKAQISQITNKFESFLSAFSTKQVLQDQKIQDLMAESKKALQQYFFKEESRKKEISCLKSQIEMFQKVNSELHQEEVLCLRAQVTEMIKLHIEKTVNCLTQELEQLKKQQSQKWAALNPQSARLPQKSKAGLSYGHHPDNPHKQHFSFLHKRHSIIIQKQSTDYNWYNFINKSEVTTGKIAKYSVKLSKITDGKLYIGFGTKSVFGNASGWPSQGNYYHCFSGCVYQGGKKQDSGVKTMNGQTLIITADLVEQKITWMKGGKIFAECGIPQQMKGKSLFFVLQFNNRGNQVELFCD